MPEFDSAYHRIHVTDNDGVRLMRFERNHQSSMRIDDPFHTDIDYVGYLHLAVAVTPRAARVLVIGLGGGSLVKRMWRDYPWMHIDAVEIDPEVADICRAFFDLPDDDRLNVIVEDGRAYMRLAPHTYDMIIVDAFDDDHVPRPLTTEEFLRDCRDHLAEDGVIAYNIIGSVFGPHSKPFRSFHRTLSNVWRNIFTFPLGVVRDTTDATRNIVVLATDADLSPDDLESRIASRVEGIVTVPGFELFAEDLYRTPIRTGDVPLICDPPPARRRPRG